ncbi:MAG: phosphonoacetaldehyde reductase [Blautia sp.]|nr:phosphonoacetaldehyde reductase [Blautia sp.]
MPQSEISISELRKWTCDKKTLLVCDKFIDDQQIKELLDWNRIVRFSDYVSNPTYESVVAGVNIFHKHACNAVVAIGGGSTIDVAKCIKLFSNMGVDAKYLEQEIVANNVPFLAIPTTAGTGSEATRYAVIYHNGEKQSITHISCIPDVVIFEASFLHDLPIYQKKATMLDALCHAIESYWSVHSTHESKGYSREAISLILKYMDGYLGNERSSESKMLKAANIAGKAINITQTTAGHAMCYKLTGLYGIAHGHAAALCVAKLWPYMISHIEQCVDVRGQNYLCSLFTELSDIMGTRSADEAAEKFQELIDGLELEAPIAREKDINVLKGSVNPIRLKNNPIKLEGSDIESLYCQILKGEKEQ